MNKFKTFMMAGVLLSITCFTGCAAQVNAGKAIVIEQRQTVPYNKAVDVNILTEEGVVSRKITVSEPVKSINVTGTDIPSSATASWYTFNITGTDQISEGYAVDDYGITNNFGMPDSTEYFRGRIFKVDGKDTYGVLVPNGYGHSIINDKNESLLGAGDLNLKIGHTIFKK